MLCRSVESQDRVGVDQVLKGDYRCSRLLLLSHLFTLTVVRCIHIKEVEILGHLCDKKSFHGRLQQFLARRHFTDGDRPGNRREGGGRGELGHYLNSRFLREL